MMTMTTFNLQHLDTMPMPMPPNWPSTKYPQKRVSIFFVLLNSTRHLNPLENDADVSFFTAGNTSLADAAAVDAALNLIVDGKNIMFLCDICSLIILEQTLLSFLPLRLPMPTWLPLPLSLFCRILVNFQSIFDEFTISSCLNQSKTLTTMHLMRLPMRQPMPLTIFLHQRVGIAIFVIMFPIKCQMQMTIMHPRCRFNHPMPMPMPVLLRLLKAHLKQVCLIPFSQMYVIYFYSRRRRDF